tara:strand:+ start:1015 stop:2094 length:1080 start_codon:yes stop_codon:yes gene_type:complete
MKKYLLLIFFSFFALSNVLAQVRFNVDINESSINLSAAFISADLFDNGSNNGKGLLFPTTDLTVFNFNLTSPPYVGANFAGRFNGLLLYNTASGMSLVGNDSVVPGFYYYFNPGPFSSPIAGINDGHWIPLAKDDDSQTLTFDANGILTLDNGGSVDLSALIGTDSQQLSIQNDSLLLSNGGAVHLDSLGSDNQTINTDLNGTDLSISIQNGNTEIVDLSSLITGLDTVYSSNDSLIVVSNGFNDTTIVDLGGLADTDDQSISGSVLSQSTLTIGIEDGTSEDVALLGLASDSLFVNTLATDSNFVTTLVSDSLFTTTLSSDSTFLTSIATDSLFTSIVFSLVLLIQLVRMIKTLVVLF